MFSNSDPADIAQLKAENAELKLRVQRLELYIELFNAPVNSPSAQAIHGRIRMIEMSMEWRAIQPEKLL